MGRLCARLPPKANQLPTRVTRSHGKPFVQLNIVAYLAATVHRFLHRICPPHVLKKFQRPLFFFLNLNQRGQPYPLPSPNPNAMHNHEHTYFLVGVVVIMS